MEEKNSKNPVAALSVFSMALTSTFWIGLFAACYLAVLPMADTIALRNVTLFGTLSCLGWHFRNGRPTREMPPLAMILWTIYLLVFPFITESTGTALHSLLNQWGVGVLALLAGGGVAAVFTSKKKSTAFYLGLISAVPVLVHLCFFVWKAWTTASIPWGYWGRESHHADLGYAAGQSVVLLTAAIFAGHEKKRSLSIVLIIACLLSTVLAHSRAGLAFSLIGGLIVVFLTYFAKEKNQRKKYQASLFGIGFLAVVFLAGSVINDVRWRNMLSELAAGFYGDAIQLQCEGTASIEPAIVARYGDQSERIITSVQLGDGSRVVLLRAGLTLALKHPWGSDGSRQAFQKLLRQECANPVISMAHTHNGWLDTMLALGWIGAILYLGLLLYFLKQGLALVQRASDLNEWALVLVAISTFWILRGFTDSVFRDHMLEMQGFVLAYASIAMKLRNQSAISSGTT